MSPVHSADITTPSHPEPWDQVETNPIGPQGPSWKSRWPAFSVLTFGWRHYTGTARILEIAQERSLGNSIIHNSSGQ
jgi:hypothetical protein